MQFVVTLFWWGDCAANRAARRLHCLWYYEWEATRAVFDTAVALPRSRRPRRPRNRHDQRYRHPKPRYQLVVQEVLPDELVVEAA